jgi:hypothetical protein
MNDQVCDDHVDEGIDAYFPARTPPLSAITAPAPFCLWPLAGRFLGPSAEAPPDGVAAPPPLPSPLPPPLLAAGEEEDDGPLFPMTGRVAPPVVMVLWCRGVHVCMRWDDELRSRRRAGCDTHLPPDWMRAVQITPIDRSINRTDRSINRTCRSNALDRRAWSSSPDARGGHGKTRSRSIALLVIVMGGVSEAVSCKLSRRMAVRGVWCDADAPITRPRVPFQGPLVGSDRLGLVYRACGAAPSDLDRMGVIDYCQAC